MIHFDRFSEGPYTEDLVLASCFLGAERVRRFGGNWIVFDGIYMDGDHVWYVFECVAADMWYQRSYGVKS